MKNEAPYRVPPRDSGCLLRLILIRHGRPEKEADGRCYGRLDIGLSAEGRKQLCEKAGLLSSLQPDALYSSTSKRARESAEQLGQHLNLRAEARPELCEIDFGAFEGLAYTEIEQRFPDEFRRWMEHPTEITFPGGESFADLNGRVSRFLAVLRDVYRGHTVLLVTHAGVNRVVLAESLGMLTSNIFRIDQAFAGINVIDYFSGHALVRLMNG